MTINLIGDRIESEPNLLFDKADSSAVHPQVYWGLRRFGPYDKGLSKIRLGIISPRNKLAQVKSLVEDIVKGTEILPGGMRRFFRCDINIVGDEYVLDSTHTNEYEKIALNFVNKEDPKNVDVVLAYIPKTGRYFSHTPYYRLKAILTSQGFCSQMITESTFMNLRWSYLNLASAIFSKAGGIPWVLESEMKNTDMILGISVSNIVSYKGRAGKRPRFVGYMNVFDNYGQWMFFEGTARMYEKGQNAEQLKELITKAVTKFKAIKGFIPKKIILHSYKRFGKVERETTASILDEIIGQYSIAFISIDESHPFRLYDLKVDDGSFPRGCYAYLGDADILLSTTGFTPIAARRMGTPKLLRIIVRQHPENFIGINEVAYQVLALTKLDWATATPLVREPITLQFSAKIAYLTAAISEQEWSGITRPEISATLSRRAWFI